MEQRRHFTEAEYRYARDEASALEYARSHGYDLVKNGRAFRLREHDSMIFTSDGRWFWNSRGLRGGAIEFAMLYEEKTLPEAVLAICETGGHTYQIAPAVQRRVSEKKQFILPEKSPSCRQLYAYLCSTRQLDRGIVSDLIRKGDLYESVWCYTNDKTGMQNEIHNAVFVGRDAEGKVKSAFQRGLSSFLGMKPFKMDVAGSDPAAPFCIAGHKGSDTVIVFEGAIDAISNASIIKAAGLNDSNAHRIALGGTEKAIALFSFLRANPQIRRIYLAMDEDEAGCIAANKLQAEIPDQYVVSQLHQHVGKDWNDYLVVWNKTLKLMQRIAMPPDSVGRIVYLESDGKPGIFHTYTDIGELRRVATGHLLAGDPIVVELKSEKRA